MDKKLKRNIFISGEGFSGAYLDTYWFYI